MSLSEPKRNASVPSKPLHRVCKLEFLVFLEFNLRDLKLRVITVFYPPPLSYFFDLFLASKSMKRELVMTPEKCVKKVHQTTCLGANFLTQHTFGFL